MVFSSVSLAIASIVQAQNCRTCGAICRLRSMLRTALRGEDRFKLMKTRIGAECGARDIYDFLIDCFVFDRCTDYALQICQHILAHGRRMR